LATGTPSWNTAEWPSNGHPIDAVSAYSDLLLLAGTVTVHLLLTKSDVRAALGWTGNFFTNRSIAPKDCFLGVVRRSYLLPQRQDLCLDRCSRPKQIDNRPDDLS